MTKPITNAEQLARALGGKRAGHQCVACCPAHNDRNPSLIIYDGHTAPQLRCLAGCEPIDVIKVLAAAGLWNGNGAGRPITTRRRRRGGAPGRTGAVNLAGRGSMPPAPWPRAICWSRGLVLPADRSRAALSSRIARAAAIVSRR